MKTGNVILPVSLSVLLTGCYITSSPPTDMTEYNTGFKGYTVGYYYGDGSDDIGDGTYIGYGGWASSFYSPGYRYGYWPYRH